MLDSVNIIQTAGLIGIFLIIFAESGLFFAFFLPGDSLLFTAGLFAQAGLFPVWPLVFGCIIAAILGGFAGYITGRKVGPRLFNKEASIFFKKKYVYEAEHFYNKHGSVAIIVARFIPIVRTFAPIVAGIGKMRSHTFFFFNILSGIIWPVIVVSAGYFIGSKVPNAEEYLLPITLGVIVISLAPIAYSFAKNHLHNHK